MTEKPLNTFQWLRLQYVKRFGSDWQDRMRAFLDLHRDAAIRLQNEIDEHRAAMRLKSAFDLMPQLSARMLDYKKAIDACNHHLDMISHLD